MKFMQSNQDIYKKIVEQICAVYPQVIAIYVFGSFISTPRSDSDLDLAVLLPAPADEVAFWNLAQQLAVSINRDVDLIDLRRASTIFRFQIIHSGNRIYCRDEVLANSFEDLVFSMYLNFNEKRAALIKSIKQRGGVYG